MVVALEKEIAQMEQDRRDEESTWQEKVKTIDMEYEQKKMEEEKKLLILKEKEKEYKIN